MRREAEHRFERDVAMKAAVVAKDEFIEVNVDVFAPQAVIRAQRPALHQRKSPMAPWQDDIGRHIADDARIMPIIARESRIGGVAIGDQRRARLHVGPRLVGKLLLKLRERPPTCHWREGVVVLIIIATTILLTLFASWMMGYTINRVSLFALIFSIGILVDDAIVVVENIVRHWSMRGSRGLVETAVEAVAEVGNPTIVATLAIIAALLPMMFVSGLMGPYMSPIPANASIAMLFSFFVAVTVTPWLLMRIAAKHFESMPV